MTREEPKWVRFVTGGMASSTAELFTLPIDTIKVRLQVQVTGKAGAQAAAAAAAATGGSAGAGASGAAARQHYTGVIDCLRKVVRHEGVGGLWKGLAPAVLRQSSYSSIRMGIYEPIRNAISGDADPTFWQKLLAGGSAGGIGIAIANPTELVKIRMQGDKAGTRYRGTLDAFRTIVRSEGVPGLWAGVGPNVQRAVVVNAAELATYDQAKVGLVNAFDLDPSSSATHFGASFIAGFFAALASSPVDVIKNRLMNQPADARLYTGMLDCAAKTVRNEGPLALYKGFIPNWFRLGPWCIVMFMSYEKYRSLARSVWDD